MTHYNTTHEPDSVAASYSITNKRQEEIVLGYMKIAKQLTPREAHMIVLADGYNWELTSTRRALDTLGHEKHIKRIGKKMGPKGRNEFIWQLREEE